MKTCPDGLLSSGRGQYSIKMSRMKAGYASQTPRSICFQRNEALLCEHPNNQFDILLNHGLGYVAEHILARVHADSRLQRAAVALITAEWRHNSPSAPAFESKCQQQK